MVENWLRVDEAASRLGFSRSKVYQMINDGVIPSVRVANRIRVSTADLEAWVRAQPSGRSGETADRPSSTPGTEAASAASKRE